MKEFEKVGAAPFRAGRKSFAGVMFTMVELLVVISIILILAGIMLPVLSSAKERGRATQCMSNVKQLVLAANLYANDYKYFPPGRLSDNKTHWCGYKNAPGDWDYKRGTMHAYLGGATGERLRTCPSFKDFVANGYDSGCGGYGYDMSGGFGGQAKRPYPASYDIPTKVDELGKHNLSKCVMFADSAITDDYTPTGKIREYPEIGAKSYSDTPWGTWNFTPGIHFRHSDMANCGFADGHVASKHAVSYVSGDGQDYTEKKLGFIEEDNYLKIGNY